MKLNKQLDVELMYDENDSFGKSPREDFEYFKYILSKYKPDADFRFLFKAFAFLVFYHRRDKRKSGKPYYTHPLWVALFLIEKFNVYDEIYLAAAFLHDTIEDTAGKNDRVTKAMIIEKFNSPELAEIVEALTKISHEKLIEENENFKFELSKKYNPRDVDAILRSKEIQKCFTHRKLFQTFVKNQNIIIIKLADRLHNMKTLHYIGEDEKAIIKQKYISDETLQFYVGFAFRLGFNKIALELQDLSFYFTDKELFKKIRGIIESKESYILERLMQYQNDIDTALQAGNISGTVINLYHRREYEIYNLTNNFKNIERLTDYVVCIISVPTDSLSDLAKITSLLITHFQHNNVSNYQEGKQSLGEYDFDTFQIRVKKENYDSLDITIMREKDHDILQNFIQVPIKEKRVKKKILDISDNELELWSNWMEYAILEKGEIAIKDIWDSLDKNLFNDKIVCYSVDQNQVFLPKDATVIDFAFALSEEAGYYFGGARIHDKIYDFDYKLSGNETIQILRSPTPTLKMLWKNYISDYRAIGYFYDWVAKTKTIEISSEFQNTQIEHSTKENLAVFNNGFYAKVLIKGYNRTHILKDITAAIGDSDIKQTKIDTNEQEDTFEGVFEVFINDIKSLNIMIVNLLNIRKVKSVQVLNVWRQ